METASPLVTSQRVLLVDDDPIFGESLSLCLREDGHRVHYVEGRESARTEAATRTFDLALVDVFLGSESGLDVVSDLAETSPSTDVIVVTAHGTMKVAVDAISRGAADCLTKPVVPEELRRCIERVVERGYDDTHGLATGPNPPTMFETRSAVMRQALRSTRRAAPTDATILLTGETGTGKGLLAKAIHTWSGRSGGFSTVSCPSLNADLLQSELFGHVKGAFTGAVADKIGKISTVDGGTLLLDEIGDLPLSLQPRLLHFLQTREYERVGDPEPHTADVRIIAATNVPMERAVAKESLREDLYHRLSVIPIEVPPLRERTEDIEPLARHFIEYFSVKHGRREVELTPDVLATIESHTWPGNVRELRNAIERAVVLGVGRSLAKGQLVPRSTALPPGDDDLLSLADAEARYISHVLDRCESIERAAEVLGISPSTLWRRRRKHGI